MRTRMLVAIVVVLVVVISVSVSSLYLLTHTLSPCNPSICSAQAQGSNEYLVGQAYSFPLGGPLTVTLYNEGSFENLAAAQYFVCNAQDSLSCVPGALSGSCSTAYLAAGSSCQAVITVSVTNLVSGTGYAFYVWKGIPISSLLRSERRNLDTWSAVCSARST